MYYRSGTDSSGRADPSRETGLHGRPGKTMSGREVKMDESVEQTILDRIKIPGWTTTRAVLQDSSDSVPKEEYRRVEEVMAALAKQGQVTLWRLIYDDGKMELTAAAKPGFELDKELEERGAWAKAERIGLDE